MKKNVGTMDRVTRGLGALGLLTCAFMAPLAVEVRGPVFGLAGVYLLYTALAGSCLGYRMMGRSTCPAESR
jgi:hypothetical protein